MNIQVEFYLLVNYIDNLVLIQNNSISLSNSKVLIAFSLRAAHLWIFLLNENENVFNLWFLCVMYVTVNENFVCIKCQGYPTLVSRYLGLTSQIKCKTRHYNVGQGESSSEKSS